MKHKLDGLFFHQRFVFVRCLPQSRLMRKRTKFDLSSAEMRINMRLVKVSKSMDIYGAIKKLYKQAFPANERAPFWLLMKRAGSSMADFWALYDGEKWVGIAYVIRHKQLAYLFYFAVQAGERGKGYGRTAIETLKEQYCGSRIFLALEALDKTADNYEQRVKRHSFYEKCGLSDMPYHLKEASVVYDIMGIGEAVEPEEYREMMDCYVGKLFRRIIDMRIIK